MQHIHPLVSRHTTLWIFGDDFAQHLNNVQDKIPHVMVGSFSGHSSHPVGFWLVRFLRLLLVVQATNPVSGPFVRLAGRQGSCGRTSGTHFRSTAIFYPVSGWLVWMCVYLLQLILYYRRIGNRLKKKSIQFNCFVFVYLVITFDWYKYKYGLTMRWTLETLFPTRIYIQM